MIRAVGEGTAGSTQNGRKRCSSEIEMQRLVPKWLRNEMGETDG